MGSEVGKAAGQGVIDGNGVGVGEAIPVKVGNGDAGRPAQSSID